MKDAQFVLLLKHLLTIVLLESGQRNATEGFFAYTSLSYRKSYQSIRLDIYD